MTRRNQPYRFGTLPPLLLLVLAAGVAPAAELPDRGDPWPRHTIDDSSRGADGVRLADVNGDGLMDITTGWEEGGITRVYLHPGHAAAAKPWPAVTVGRTRSVEDAVFADLDGDGNTDVVTCCEGGTRTMFVHWAPKQRQRYLDPAAWQTEPIPASQGKMMWMFCMPMQVDGRDGIDLIAGAKGQGAQIGWFRAPADPRQLDRWQWHPISPAGWIMSLRGVDLDGDGDRDVLCSDRRGDLRGCRWLENPGPGPALSLPWKNHPIGAADCEVMFLDVADLDGDGRNDVLAAAKGGAIHLLRRQENGNWKSDCIAMPGNTGTGKAVACGDIDGDRRPDVVFSCEHAQAPKSGVVWLSFDESPAQNRWMAHEISGPIGIKFDRMELLDIDGDGDPDVLGCEESQPVAGKRHGLGVFWYENPARAAKAAGRKRPR